jgi:hypothetical protein
MTSYPPTYFSKTTGTLEQLVLATVTQSLVNKDYVLNIIRDFTRGSINWNVVLSATESDTPQAYLNLDLTFPLIPFDRQMLTDSPSFDRRVASMNALSIDQTSLPQEPTYTEKSYPAQLAAYLSVDDDQNTLERRLMALVLHARNVQNWIARWNHWAGEWFIAQYYPANNVFRPYNFPTLVEIEVIRDAMIDELTDGIIYQPVPIPLAEAVNYRPIAVNPGNVRAEMEVLNNDPGGSDPAAISSTLPAQELLKSLTDQYSGFAGNTSDPTIPATPEESPTLPDC